MKRVLVFSAVAILATTAQASTVWQQLWSTPDQRGSQLLQQGKPTEAVKEFSDPHRKAYAELVSGGYADAARDYGQFGDTDAQYNRGNALAHAGDLAGAIKAYDAALARDPNNQDARHNRDLVAKAMSKQPPAQQSTAGNNSEPNKSSQDKQSGNGKSASEQSKSSSGDGKAGTNSQSQSGAGSQAQSGANSQSQSDHGNPGGQKESGNDQQAGSGKPSEQREGAGTQAGENTSPKSSQAAATGARGEARPAAQGPGQEQNVDLSSVSNGSQAVDDKEQAARDAAASLSSSRPDAGTHPDTRKPNGVGDAIGAEEKQLAKEQWLRNIPDDPGGLLRRKLLIEHMMRQQKVQP